MSRRSERLVSQGYYNEDGVANISYKENIKPVFKKRRRHRTAPCALEIVENNPLVDVQERNLKWYTIFPLLFLLLGIMWPCQYIILSRTSAVAECESFGSKLQLEVCDLRQDLVALKNKLDPQAYSLGDFALEAYRAKIVHHLTSKTHQQKSACLRQCDVDRNFNTPNNVIRGQSYPLIPGHCWPLEGSRGQLVIALAGNIRISHVTLAHIMKEQSPTGQISSAPRKFSVYGLKDINREETKLGTFEYNDTGDSFQTFKIQDHTDEIFGFVRLAIESNYGNPDYTCLYNFRVHGRMPGVE